MVYAEVGAVADMVPGATYAVELWAGPADGETRRIVAGEHTFFLAQDGKGRQHVYRPMPERPWRWTWRGLLADQP